jgi:hypothetical protein
VKVAKKLFFCFLGVQPIKFMRLQGLMFRKKIICGGPIKEAYMTKKKKEKEI